MIERELSENTVSSYITAMEQFFEEFAEINKANALEWKRGLLESGRNPKTVNLRLSAYNAWCKMHDAPKAMIKKIKVHQASAVSNVISKDDYERLIECLKRDDKRWYYNIRLLAATGARVSEYIRLCKADFDRGYAEMWTKGKMRRIYIPRSFRDEAASYYAGFDDHEPLAISKRGTALTSRGVAAQLKAFSARYQIPPEVMHPHSFRHLFAVNFLKHNQNLSLLADVMGHSSVSTTAIYTRMTKEQQISEVDSTVKW